MTEKAVVLLSGGLDSATCLAIAAARQLRCYALSFNYTQRSQSELQCARRLAKQFAVAEHVVFDLDIGQFKGSALTDHAQQMPEQVTDDIPTTYVPARNTIMLSVALGWAEVLQAQHIFIGVNAVDYSNYPDCRPEYIEAFSRMAQLATKAGVEGQPIQIHAPLMHLSKAQIIEQGMALGVDYSKTCSCYQADAAGRACGKCPSCQLRREGFASAGITDPTFYQ
jgi:7-cyano-7-deazaguanine synthase